MAAFVTTILLLSAASSCVDCLIGYDCGGQRLNVTTISLLEAEECNLKITTPTKTEVYIQLLQLSEYNYAETIQCKVQLLRTVFYCGMHSHISAVHEGTIEYLEETLYERCKRMHQDGVINLGYGEGSIIKGLRVNETQAHSITIAGEIDRDGKCRGIKYQDSYGSWENVVVQGMATITLRTSYVPVHLNTGRIILKSGTTCDLSQGFCIDSDNGYSFWRTIPTSSCDFHQYDVLYEGQAIEIKDVEQGQHRPTVYSLNTDDITFALTTTREQPVCGYTLLRTEHPKLFIIKTSKGNTPKQRTNILVDNLDIFTYVNSKFVYVERHVRTQMTTLYHNVMQQRCELEAEVMRNTLSFATLLPDEFAYRLMNGPGYMAVTAGEAIHVVKCTPVDVMVRRTEECYQELPVKIRNASLFLSPKSHILTKFGTRRECSHELPTLYRIEDTWVEFFPEPRTNLAPPQKLQPLTRMTWKYITPESLADSGIYTSQDIDRLRDHIMFPVEKPALLNSLVRGINGYNDKGERTPLQNLLNEDALNKIAESTAKRLWGGFVIFGSATAGVLGIFIILRVIKIIIDTAIHGYALHTVYGCSVHLLGAIWSSLAHLLIHLAHPPPKKEEEEPKHARSYRRPPSRPSSTPPTPTEPQYTKILITQPTNTQCPSTSVLTNNAPVNTTRTQAERNYEYKELCRKYEVVDN